MHVHTKTVHRDQKTNLGHTLAFLHGPDAFETLSISRIFLFSLAPEWARNEKLYITHCALAAVAQSKLEQTHMHNMSVWKSLSTFKAQLSLQQLRERSLRTKQTYTIHISRARFAFGILIGRASKCLPGRHSRRKCEFFIISRKVRLLRQEIRTRREK